MVNFAIKDNAMDYVRYVSINDNRADKSYQKWYEASKSTPSQGLHIMKMAEFSRINELNRDLEFDNLSLEEYTSRVKAIIKNTVGKQLREDTADLSRSIKEHFPQTYAKRLAIISSCEDDFWGKICLASQNKSRKKLLTSFFKIAIK